VSKSSSTINEIKLEASKLLRFLQESNEQAGDLMDWEEAADEA
jgi:hypothetical protein